MSENQIQDYVTFGRTFEKYKWYKPILTGVLATILFAIFNIIALILFTAVFGETFMNAISLGYEGMNTPDAANFFGFLSLVLVLPSIYLASRVVKDRPFSSYASSRGGWNWKIYFKCILIALIVYIISTILSLAIFGSSNGPNNLNILFIAFLIIIPLQCIAEEFLFRGFLMQTLGSWIKIPIAAIVIQGILFGLLHAYNSIGIIAIIGSGIIMGIVAWKANGLEASSAMHTINNIFSLLLGLSGLQLASSTVNPIDLVWIILVDAVCAGLILYIGNKYDWFTSQD